MWQWGAAIASLKGATNMASRGKVFIRSNPCNRRVWFRGLGVVGATPVLALPSAFLNPGCGPAMAALEALIGSTAKTLGLGVIVIHQLVFYVSVQPDEASIF